MPANSDQQGGKSGKIHFIESTVYSGPHGWLCPQNVQFQDPEGEPGDACAPWEEHRWCPKGPDLQPSCGF